MSIPLDHLYHYIENVAKEVRNDNVIIYRFYPHGSKKIEDLTRANSDTWLQCKLLPEIICYDQEPLDYNAYQNVVVNSGESLKLSTGLEKILPMCNIRYHYGNIYDKCLLLHSEQRSNELTKYCNDQYIPVYYWSHAVIARDWYRYAKFETFNKSESKTFLIYNRAWSGTREYRIKFSDLLIEHNLVDQCRTKFNDNDPETGQTYQMHQYKNPQWMPTHQLENYFTKTMAPASSSAGFDTNDYNSTDFEIVLETLFDDSRIHLTEKSLRPIACNQPFILASTHGSLEYLKRYGFQTFSSVIDETYDSVVDPYQRMLSIFDTMKQITAWSKTEKLANMKKIKAITEFNQQYFFSDKFIDIVLSELRYNLSTAFEELELSNTCQHYLDVRRRLKTDPMIKQLIQQREYWTRESTTRQDWLEVLYKIKYYRQKNRKNNQG
jgi:hypothetical protein